MNKNGIRHIVFDVGNVLVLWERERPYHTLIPDELERRRFLDEVCPMEWHLTLDEGVGIDDAIADRTARFPEHTELIAAYKSRWLEQIPGAIDGTVEILKALVTQGHDVTALTNFNQDLFKLTVAAYPFLALFRGVTVSGEARMTKPNPAIYAHHTKAFGLEPSATLFFDDSPKNIEAARKAGWNAELFTSPAKMREDLAEYRILELR
jgi:2-haloacid dehalogenase